VLPLIALTFQLHAIRRQDWASQPTF